MIGNKINYLIFVKTNVNDRCFLSCGEEKGRVVEISVSQGDIKLRVY